MGRVRPSAGAGLRDRTFEAGPFPGRGADGTPQVLEAGTSEDHGGVPDPAPLHPPPSPSPKGPGPSTWGRPAVLPLSVHLHQPDARLPDPGLQRRLVLRIHSLAPELRAQGQVGMADRPRRRPPHRGILEPDSRCDSSASYLALPLGLHGSPAGLPATPFQPPPRLPLLLPHSGSFPTLHPPPAALIGPEHVPASGAGGWAEAPLHVNLGRKLRHRCGPSRGYPMLCLEQELWASPFIPEECTLPWLPLSVRMEGPN